MDISRVFFSTFIELLSTNKGEIGFPCEITVSLSFTLAMLFLIVVLLYYNAFHSRYPPVIFSEPIATEQPSKPSSWSFASLKRSYYRYTFELPHASYIWPRYIEWLWQVLYIYTAAQKFRLCSYLLNMGATVVERLIRYPCHTLLPIWRCGVVHCHPGTQKLTEVYEIYHELTGQVLAHDIHIVFLVYGSKNLQQMTKMTFSPLLFVLEFMVRNTTAFYCGCWYIATQSVLPLRL